MAARKTQRCKGTAWLIVSAMTTAVTFAAVDCVRAADDWPNRPITMINPFAAGGPNDVPARMFAQRMGGFSASKSSLRMSAVQVG